MAKEKTTVVKKSTTPKVKAEKKVGNTKEVVKQTVEGHNILTIDKVNGMFDIRTEDGLRFILSKEEFNLSVK